MAGKKGRQRQWISYSRSKETRWRKKPSVVCTLAPDGRFCALVSTAPLHVWGNGQAFFKKPRGSPFNKSKTGTSTGMRCSNHVNCINHDKRGFQMQRFLKIIEHSSNSLPKPNGHLRSCQARLPLLELNKCQKMLIPLIL